jgi:hypothetical protein
MGKNRFLLKTLTILIFSLMGSSCGERMNARLLNLDIFQECVCKGRQYNAGSNICEERSVWLEADSGLIAYVTVYGVKTTTEAREIVEFLASEKKRNKQDDIPVDLTIYSTPRSIGRRPKESELFHKRI